MEQKILHSYTTSGSNDETSGTASGTGHADNPVLIWSLALMWAFVIVIVGHAKIADWIEGGDPGRLADLVEWLFN